MTDVRNEIYRPIRAAIILLLAFYAIEIPIVLANVFPNQASLYTADFVLRCIAGTIALITGIVLVIMLFKQRWLDVGICGAIEGACFLILLAAAWMIANFEDLNKFLIRFLHS